MDINNKNFSASAVVRLFSVFCVVGVALNLYVSEYDTQIATALSRLDHGASLKSAFFYPIFFAFFASLYLDLISKSKVAAAPYGYVGMLLICTMFFSIKSVNFLGSVVEILSEFVFYSLAISSFKYRNFDKVFLLICAVYFLLSASGCYVQSEYFMMSASHDFSCRGLSPHRNTFAPQVIFVGVLAIAVTRSRNIRWLALVGVLGLILMTKSVTAISLMALLIALYFSRGVIAFFSVPPLVYLGGVMLVSLLLILAGNTLLTVFAGREESFLIRILIWQVASSTLEPYFFFGEGFKSAYAPAILDSLTSVSAWDDASGFHNSFFEMWRQFGLIGAIFIIILLTAWIMVIIYRRSTREDSVFWFLSALALYFIYGLVESGFTISFSIWSLVTLRLGWLVLYEKRNKENYHRL